MQHILLLDFPTRLIQFASRTVGTSQPFLITTATLHPTHLQPLTATYAITALQLPSAQFNCQVGVVIEVAAPGANRNDSDVKQLLPDSLKLT